MLNTQSGVVATPIANPARRLAVIAQERKHVLLAAVIGLAVLSRLPGLMNDGLWRDEGNVYVLATSPNLGELLQRITQTQWHPPLFFVLLYFWVKAVGANEFTLKVLPFIAGTLTVPVVYRLGKDIAGGFAGILAAAIYAVSPVAVTFATETLYPMTGLFSTVLAWLVVRHRREPASAVRLISISLMSALVIYSHYIALIYLPLLMLWAAAPGTTVRSWLSIAGAILLGALTFVFWIPVVVSQQHTGLPYRPEITHIQQLVFFISVLLRIMPAWPPAIQWVLFAFSVVAASASARVLSRNLDAIATAIIFLAILAFATISGLTEVRYVVPFYGLFCVFFAFITVQFIALARSQDLTGWHRVGRFVVAAVTAVVLIGDSAYALTSSDMPKSGIRSLVASQGLNRRTLYIIAPDYLSSTFAFYSRDKRVHFRGFVRANHPEIFRIPTYATEWGRPDAVKHSLEAIQRESTHYKFIALIVDDNARDRGRMHYGKVWDLLGHLKDRYRLLSEARFPGRMESVSEYEFRAFKT